MSTSPTQGRGSRRPGDGPSTLPATGQPRPTTQTVRPPPLPLKQSDAAPPVAENRWTRWLSGVLGAGKVCFYTVAPLAMLAIIATSVLYVRLTHGPIAFDFIVPPLQRGINAELVRNQVRIEGAELRLGRDGAPEFRLRDLSVLDPDGTVVLSAPLAAFSMSAAALLRGRVVPARIELIDPKITLTYTENEGLIFEQPPSPAEPPPEAAGVPRPVEAHRASDPQKLEINIAKWLSDVSRRARRGVDVSHYLTEFGLSNATLTVNYAGHGTSWNIPEASFDFNHGRKRSIISGRASISSPGNPWAVSFLTDESEKTGRLQVKATVRDLRASTLAGTAPPLALLRMFDIPVGADATVELSTAGEIATAELALELGPGRVVIPDMKRPLNVSAGLFKMNYEGAVRRWELQPSPFKWADGSIMLTGAMQDKAQPESAPEWQFNLEGKNGVFEASQFNVPPVMIESWLAQGTIVPRRGVVDISDFHIRGGGGEAHAKATTQAGPNGQSLKAEIAISPMPLATLKVLWPSILAPGGRKWVGEAVTAADFLGGTVHYVNDLLAAGDAGAPTTGKREHVNATFEFKDAAFIPLAGVAPLKAPRGLVQVQDNALEITIPEAALQLSNDRFVPLKAGRYYSPDAIVPDPDAEITFKAQSQLAPFLEAVETLPVRAVREATPFPQAGEGKVDADITLKMRLVDNLSPDDIAILGKARISDGRFGKVADRFDVQGFTLNLDLTETSLDAKGDLLINGVPAKIIGQRVFGAQSDQQPPIKILAKLDDADRTQLGLDANDLVNGVVPVEITLQRTGRPEAVVNLKADLTDAELSLRQFGWRKPPGNRASLETDLVKGKVDKTELQNFKLVGDDIAINGWIGVGADNRVREFSFPEFNLNVISRLEVQGTLDKDNIWKIKANGPTFDGRSLFHSLLAVGDGPSKSSAQSSKASAGTDLSAEIGNVIGGNDISLRAAKIKLSTRSDKLAALDLKGTLDGGAPLAAVLDASGGNRRLKVDSTDAGQVLRFVDFYQNMQSGRLRLEVDLEGKGAADKTGTLWVENFSILGDPVVDEVVNSADQGRPAISGKKKVTRQVFEFDQLRAPFSTGYGQFVLEDAYMKGPLAGANVRGKVDFKTRRMNIGGTYIPLQGLNGALGGIPVLGQLLSGAQGEGIFGITFAVQGPMSEPQVIVNPLSMVAPGIFREIFSMTAANPQVQVREENTPKKPVQERVRASSASSSSEPPQRAPSKPKRGTDNVDGWSSTTQPN